MKKQNKQTEYYIVKAGKEFVRLYGIPQNEKFWILFSFYDLAFTMTISSHIKSINAIRETAEQLTEQEFDKTIKKLSKKKKRLQNLVMEYISIAKLVLG